MHVIGPLGLCFLGWQILLPAAVLPQQGGRRFGWQMFATAYTNPVIIRESAAGADSDTLPLRDVIAYLRADMELGEGAGRQLCARPGTIAISISAHGGLPARRYPCGE